MGEDSEIQLQNGNLAPEEVFADMALLDKRVSRSPWNAKQLEEKRHGAHCAGIYIAKHNEKVVGFVLVDNWGSEDNKKDYTDILRFVVDPDYPQAAKVLLEQVKTDTKKCNKITFDHNRWVKTEPEAKEGGYDRHTYFSSIKFKGEIGDPILPLLRDEGFSSFPLGTDTNLVDMMLPVPIRNSQWKDHASQPRNQAKREK